MRKSEKEKMTEKVLAFIKVSGTPLLAMENQFYTLPMVWKEILPQLIRDGAVRHEGNVYYNMTIIKD